MRSALSKVDGVQAVDVDYESKTATITCSGGCDRAELIGALEGTGFSAEVQK